MFKLRNSVEIENFEKPYVVAEINTSHFGKIETAKKMVEEAAKAGCDCVKFQSWSAESLYSRTYYDQNPVSKRFVKRFSFSEEQLAEIVSFCQDCGISFSSTPYAEGEVDFLMEKADAPFIKIASMELNNLPFLDYIGKTGSPIILSTGMGDMTEIEKAVETLANAGNKNVCLLHCVSIYPPDLSTLNLNNIVGLQETFPGYAVGYSDHSLGIEIPSAAVALGACVIEKHFTLDHTKIGMDNNMAIEPQQMAQMVTNCRNVQIALGGKERVLLPDEITQRANMRRSVIAAKDLKEGTKLTQKDLATKRPGNGIPPECLEKLIGRTVKKDIDGDTVLLEIDLSDE